jgi:TRAP-type C4-dicarboxylate transport system permease small subunit
MSSDTSSGVTSDVRAPLPGKLLQWLTDGVCGLAVAAIVAVVLMQVLGRLMSAPFSWTEELTRACFIWMVFAGMAASVRHADAARVTVLLRYFPRLVKKSALPIYVVCNLVFFVLTAWTGWSMVRQQVMMNEQIATLGWPGWVVGIILPAAALLSIFSLMQSLRTHRAAIAASDETL